MGTLGRCYQIGFGGGPILLRIPVCVCMCVRVYMYMYVCALQVPNQVHVVLACP